MKKKTMSNVMFSTDRTNHQNTGGGVATGDCDRGLRPHVFVRCILMSRYQSRVPSGPGDRVSGRIDDVDV